MKTILAIVLIFLFFPGAWARVLIVSDVDDTIKQSNVLNTVDSILSIKKSTPEFRYMNRIFHELKNNFQKEGVDFVYLSSSPHCVNKQERWIEDKKFPTGYVIQKSCDLFFSKIFFSRFAFKVKMLTQFMDLNAKLFDEVYYFGDNAERDPDVYKTIVEKYPQIKSKIYIRDIKVEATEVDKTLEIKRLEGINYFFTEKDLVSSADFSFLPDNLTQEIKSLYIQSKLHPAYLADNLAKRYQKEQNKGEQEAREKAHEAIKKYIESDHP